VEQVVDEMFAARAPRSVEPYPDCRAGLAALRAFGLQIGLCSNWDWDLPELVCAAGLTDAFDVIISSAHAGSRKPHPSFYAYALDRCDVKADQVLFVGDTVDADVAGPMAAGMHAAFIDRAEPAVWVGLAGEIPKGGDQPLPFGAAVVSDLSGVTALVTGDRRE
jgi:HAD superfamily hydrolase (TIGR01509 family)